MGWRLILYSIESEIKPATPMFILTGGELVKEKIEEQFYLIPYALPVRLPRLLLCSIVCFVTCKHVAF